MTTHTIVSKLNVRELARTAFAAVAENTQSLETFIQESKLHFADHGVELEFFYRIYGASVRMSKNINRIEMNSRPQLAIV